MKSKSEWTPMHIVSQWWDALCLPKFETHLAVSCSYMTLKPICYANNC